MHLLIRRQRCQSVRIAFNLWADGSRDLSVGCKYYCVIPRALAHKIQRPASVPHLAPISVGSPCMGEELSTYATVHDQRAQLSDRVLLTHDFPTSLASPALQQNITFYVSLRPDG